MIEALQFDFMRNALVAGILVSIACGVIGVLVVINRLVFLSGGIAHAAYGGIGIAYFFNLNPIIGAALFSLASALGMGYVQRHAHQRADTLIGVMWALGMAIGVIFVDLTPGYTSDLMNYLFGSILTVSTTDLLLMFIIDIVNVILVTLFYKLLLLTAFDETFASVRNVPVNFIYLLLVSLIGLTVVMMMRVVGLVMVIALLTIPAAISSQFANNLRHMMLLAAALGIVFSTIGLWISYSLNLTSGASIILVAGIAYVFILIGKAVWQALEPNER